MTTNVDFILDRSVEDLQIGLNGDLAVSNGERTVPLAIARRASTPQGGYARMVRQQDSAEVLNSTYYSDLPFLLSTSNLDETDLANAVINSAFADGRSEVLEATVTQQSPGNYNLSFVYQISNLVIESFETLL